MKGLVFKACWDTENDCDLADGYTPRSDERLASLKIGPLVFIWGVEEW